MHRGSSLALLFSLVLSIAGPSRGLPAWLEAERDAAASDPAHRPRAIDGAQVFVTHGAQVDGSGLSALAGDGAIGLSLVAIERGGTGRDVGSATPVAVGPEVRIDRGEGATEWFRSLRAGIEHGVTLASRPRGEGPLTLRWRADGASRVHREGDRIALRDDAGRLLARYGHLAVIDADGARQPAHLEAVGGEIRVVVDDRAARYPLVIDPVLYAVREASLRASDGAAYDLLGGAVAISGDGLRVIGGARQRDVGSATDAGSARVFRRSGAGWIEEALLVAADAGAGDDLGRTVAIDGDGDVALVGAPLDDTAMGTDRGSVRVFRRSGTSWSEAPPIAPFAGLQYGRAIALSGDGAYAIVGDSFQANARVYRWDGAQFVEQAVLAAAVANFGGSVALDATGTYALVGAPNEPRMAVLNVGSVRVFHRVGTSWTEEATLRASDGAAGDVFGSAVALSADASVAIVGAPGDNTPTADAGSARMFVRAGSAWSEEGTLLDDPPLNNVGFGTFVAVSGDGRVASVGRRVGVRAMVYVRGGSTWSSELSVSGEFVSSPGPNAVALDAAGARLALGLSLEPGGAYASGAINVYALASGEANGDACSGASMCASGNCWAGVCCDQPCYDGCSACTAELTGGVDGTCAPYAPSIAPTIECRSPSSPEDGDALCDAPEFCTSTSLTCPDDAVLAAGTSCRSAAMGCDAAEVCDGSSHDCPVDAPRPSGSMCRASIGPCDAAEACDGTSFACPADLRAPLGVVCRGVEGTCDVEERCDGVSASCPANVVREAGASCRPSVGPCDVAEVCDGSGGACPPESFAPSGTVCSALVSGVCDVPDVCSGTSANCPETYLSGVECRAASGPCDRPEVCLGDGAACPSDGVEPAGMSCRASTAACDPEERCDGVATSCPADVIACEDGSIGDAGPTGDGGPSGSGDGGDAGGPVAATGCSCRAASRSGGPSIGVVVWLWLTLWMARRRRAVGARR